MPDYPPHPPPSPSPPASTTRSGVPIPLPAPPPFVNADEASTQSSERFAYDATVKFGSLWFGLMRFD